MPIIDSITDGFIKHLLNLFQPFTKSECQLQVKVKHTEVKRRCPHVLQWYGVSLLLIRSIFNLKFIKEKNCSINFQILLLDLHDMFYEEDHHPRTVDCCIVYGAPLAISFLLVQRYSVPILH